MVTDSNSQTTSVFARPWTQLIIGIICMVMIANLQYGWTLFVGPIGDKYHWSKAAIQVTFTIFVLLALQYGWTDSTRMVVGAPFSK